MTESIKLEQKTLDFTSDSLMNYITLGEAP